MKRTILVFALCVFIALTNSSLAQSGVNLSGKFSGKASTQSDTLFGKPIMVSFNLKEQTWQLVLDVEGEDLNYEIPISNYDARTIINDPFVYAIIYHRKNDSITILTTAR